MAASWDTLEETGQKWLMPHGPIAGVGLDTGLPVIGLPAHHLFRIPHLLGQQQGALACLPGMGAQTFT